MNMDFSKPQTTISLSSRFWLTQQDSAYVRCSAVMNETLAIIWQLFLAGLKFDSCDRNFNLN